MSSKFNTHSTIYGDYVEGQVRELAKRGGGNWNFMEIASVLELSPTHNLRKRLKTLERDGLLRISYGQIGGCAWCLIYTIPNKSLHNS